MVAVMLSLNRDSRIIGETRVKTTWTIVKPLYRYHVNGNADIMGPIAGSKAYNVGTYISVFVFQSYYFFSSTFCNFYFCFVFLYFFFFLVLISRRLCS